MFTKILQNGLYTEFFVPGAEEIPLFAILLAVLAAYLLGSINSAVLVSRILFAEDIRTKGSGNAGLTNMFRVYGKRAALFTLLGDMLKTALAVLLTALFFGLHYRAALSFSPICYLAAIACVVGHILPVFYGFRGGKGVLCATTAILVLAPPVFLVLFAVFALIVWVTKYISLGSIVAAGLLPIALQGYMQAFIFAGDPDSYFDGGIVLFGFVFTLIIIFCHRANIGRLWRHEENKFSFRRKSDSEDKK